jgi:hypothetical protein
MRQYIEDKRDEMFAHGADSLMRLLDMAAVAVSDMLKDEVSDLPKKVCSSLNC